jgi:hypothetical protein
MAVYNIEIKYQGGPWQHHAGPFSDLATAQAYVSELRSIARESQASMQNISSENKSMLDAIMQSGSQAARDKISHYRSGGASTEYRIVS